jgi:hypothetical protein
MGAIYFKASKRLMYFGIPTIRNILVFITIKSCIMKKLFTLATMLFLSAATLVNAQTTTKAATSTKSATTVHLKKNGTPDKRYKENKTTTVHLKKDGTPDMRYKENKKTTTTVTKKKS